MTDEPAPQTPHGIQKPKQQRSIARYHHILDTAAAMFVRHGYEQVGTNQIAAEAGVSVGSLYRFFSDKEAVVDALAERYIEGITAQLPDVFPPGVPMPDLVGGMLSGLFVFASENPAFDHLLTTTQTGAVARASVQIHLTIEAWVARMLSHYHPHLSESQRQLCAASGMGIVKGMMTMAHPPDSVPFEVVQREMVAALMAYVGSFVARNPPG